MLTVAAGERILVSRVFGTVNKFGQNMAVASDTQEDIWDGGGTYVFPATALITKISQKTNQATLQGEDVEIQGLDENWDLVVQMATLDATDTTTPVTLATPLIRVFRMKVMSLVVGTANISVHNDANDHDYAIVTAGNNQTLMSIYTIPAGVTGYITRGYASTTEATGKEPKSTEIRMWMQNIAAGFTFQLKKALGIPKAGGMINVSFLPYGKVSEKTDIKMSAYCEDEAGNVSSGFDIILISDV